tara:strand:+ start:546 stop:1112 length:567 start_codon:yes stop_codon:yes gene_type:complete
MQKIINKEFDSHLIAAKATAENIPENIEEAAKVCIECLKNDGKILLFGNGGSAGDAQHIAAELVGRYKNERKALSAIALTTDTSALTCIGNDYGYEKVFSRQVEALALKGDVVIGISTGGTSINVLNALKTANRIGCISIGLSGRSGGQFNSLCDINLIAQSDETARIQEIHILIGHIICELIDLEYS